MRGAARRVPLLRRRLLRRPGLHLEVPLDAGRRRSARRADGGFLRRARPHLRLRAQGADPARQSARGAHRRRPGRSSQEDDWSAGCAASRSSAPRRSCCPSSRRPVESGGLRPRGAAGGRYRSPARPSSSRTTPRRWSRRAGAAASTRSGNLVLERSVQLKGTAMSLSAQTLDPVTVEVVRNKLDGIANEMELTLLKSSFSPIVKEGLDASASLFTLRGRDAGAGDRHPDPSRHAHPLRRAASCVEFPVESMREGDIYMHERPLSRRHASARYRRRHAGLRTTAARSPSPPP